MAKLRQAYSATSFLGQAGIETYYPEVSECFNVRRRRRFVVRACSQAVSSRVSTMSDSLEGFPIFGGERKVVVLGYIPSEVDPGLLDEIQKSIGKVRNRASAGF